MSSRNKCPPAFLALSVIHLLICMLLILTVLYGFYRYVTNMKNDAIAKWRKVALIIFLISTILSIGLFHLWIIGWRCYRFADITYDIIEILFISAYLIQIYLMLIIFLGKVYQVSQTSIAFRIRKSTVYIYSILLGCMPLYTVIGVSIYELNLVSTRIGYTFSVILMVYYVIMSSSLVTLFIKKLLSIYRRLDHEDAEFLIKPITKTTILATVAIPLIFINASVLLIYTYFYSIYIEWICKFVGLIDIYSNFICIILCNKMFQSNYLKICSRLDKLCNIFCTKIADNMEGDNLKQTHVAIDRNTSVTSNNQDEL